MTNYERSREIAKNPADTEANIGFVTEHLIKELECFRPDVDEFCITRRYLADERVRWAVCYGIEVMGVGDTLVGATIKALDRSGHEWA
jgi:hypothetical protein